MNLASAILVSFIGISMALPASAQTHANTNVGFSVSESTLRRLGQQSAESALGVFASCVLREARSKANWFLVKSDPGITRFEEVKTDSVVASDYLHLDKCGERAIRASQGSGGIVLNASIIRSSLVERAYLEDFPAGATWKREGQDPPTRQVRLSAGSSEITGKIEIADCVVAGVPIAADYYLRSGRSPRDSQVALEELQPAIQSCRSRGNNTDISAVELRAILAEALWFASGGSLRAQAAARRAAAPSPPQDYSRSREARFAQCVWEKNPDVIRRLAMPDREVSGPAFREAISLCHYPSDAGFVMGKFTPTVEALAATQEASE